MSSTTVAPATADQLNTRPYSLIATCIKPSTRSQEINGKPLVLKNGEIFIDTAATILKNTSNTSTIGSFLLHPSSSSCLVTGLSKAASETSELYVDSQTYKLRYGSRSEASSHLRRPFGCTKNNHFTFKEWEGFCAVELDDGGWAIYFDAEDDGLRGRVKKGTRVLEIELERREEVPHAQRATIANASIQPLPEVRLTTRTPEEVSVISQSPLSAEDQQDVANVLPSGNQAGAEQFAAPCLPITARTIVHVHPPVIESVTRLSHRKRNSRSIGAQYKMPVQHRNATNSRHDSIHQAGKARERSKCEMTEEWVNSINFSRDLSLSFNVAREDICPSKHKRSGSKVKAVLRRLSLPHNAKLAPKRRNTEEPRGRRLQKASGPPKTPEPFACVPTMPNGHSWLRRRFSFRPKTAPTRSSTSSYPPDKPVRELKVEQDLAVGHPSATLTVQDKVDGLWWPRPSKIRRSFSVRRKPLWV